MTIYFWGKVLSKFKLYIMTLSLGLCLIFFQNCGQVFKANESSSSLSLCKVQGAKSSPFISSKVAIKKSVFNSSFQKLKIDQNDDYSLIVNSRCLKALVEPLQFLGQDIVVPSGFDNFAKVSVKIQLPQGTQLEEIESEVNKSECLIAIAENQIVKNTQLRVLPVNDPEATNQAHLTYLDYSTSRGLQVDITEPVIVAFVDSGVDTDHPEISARLWDDGLGNHGHNIITDNNNVEDVDGHGTHVAGIVAATENNGTSVSGLTGNYVQIMAVKVLERGAGTSQDVANGIRYAVEHGADVINLSIESPGQNPQIEDAIRDAIAAGVFITAAAGNQAEKMTSTNLFAPAYIGPQLNGIISVGSIDISDNLLSVFSNYSSTYVEIAAPGAETSSNATNAGGILSLNIGGSIARIQGTSQATPMITAAAAMIIGFLKTHEISYTPAGIESFIKSDGSMTNRNLVSKISEGRILQLGFLAQNLYEYIESTDKPNFEGEVSTGNSCQIY